MNTLKPGDKIVFKPTQEVFTFVKYLIDDEDDCIAIIHNERFGDLPICSFRDYVKLVAQ